MSASVDRSTGFEERIFVPNGVEEQKCLITAEGGEKISVVFRQREPQLCVCVKSHTEWKPVSQSNLPKELQQGPSDALETLIKVAAFTVSYFDNGDCKIELQVSRGMLGGVAGQLQKKVQEQLALQALVRKIGGELSSLPLTLSSSVFGNATGTLSGIAAAMLIGETAIVIAGGPLTLIPLLIVSLIGTACILAGVSLDVRASDREKKEEALKKLITQTATCFQEAQEAYHQGNEAEIVKVVNTFIDKLKLQKFVKEYSSLLFEFDEAGFNQIKDLYAKEDREKALELMKLMILFSIELLPPEQCPTPSVLLCLEKINREKVPSNVQEYIALVTGRLYLNKGNKALARENFLHVPETSTLYPLAQEYLSIIDSMKPQAGLA